jgi:branched-chain amino acid transport system permease protein
MPVDLQQAIATGFFLGLVYGLIAVGFSITFGVMRIANFAHGQFVMMGMYLMIFLRQDVAVPVWVAIPVTGLIVAVAGMLIERVAIEPIIRYSRFMQMLVTLGVLMILEQLAAILFGDQALGLDVRVRAFDLWIGSAFVSGARVVAGIAALAVISLVFVALKKTYFGRAVRAVADSRVSAELLGVRTRRVNVVAFGLGAGCAGLAGSLIIPFSFVNPLVGLGMTMKSFIVVMVGGSASIRRVVVVAIALGMVESVSGIYVPLSIVPGVVYAVLIATLVVLMLRQHRQGSLLMLGEKEGT